MGDFRPENGVPYVVHEAAMARAERIIRRLWILTLVLVLLLVASNVAWLYYEAQFEDIVTTETYTQEASSDDGGNAVINGTGEVNIYGQSQNDKN